MKPERARYCLSRVRANLSAWPNVAGVGLGWKESSGEITSIPAWRVYVTQKVPHRDLPSLDLIPGWFMGLATDVVPMHPVLPALQIAMATVLESGAAITNMRGALSSQTRDGEDCGTSGIGTLGFFVLRNGVRQREVLMVSNRHVLFAHGAKRGDTIYAPEILKRDCRQMVRAGTLEPIGQLSLEGAEGNYPFQYEGEPLDDYFVDCAAARVISGHARHKIAGSRGETIDVRGIARLHPLDTAGRRAPRVRKFGNATGMTTGTVVDVAAPVGGYGLQTERMNNIVIRGDAGCFVSQGDSGALLLNDRNQAAGLIWGRNERDPRYAYACHIHPVLHCLDVTFMSGGMA